MVTYVKDYLLDSKATRHIYGKRSAFASYTTVRKGQDQVFIDDSGMSLVINKEKVLKQTSGKMLTLGDVLHMLDIHWKLVLVSLIEKVRVKILFDYDKIILTKNDVLIGKKLL